MKKILPTSHPTKTSGNLLVSVNTTKVPTQLRFLLFTSVFDEDFASSVHLFNIQLIPQSTYEAGKCSLIFLPFQSRKKTLWKGEKFNFVFTAQKSEDLELRDKSAKL